MKYCVDVPWGKILATDLLNTSSPIWNICLFRSYTDVKLHTYIPKLQMYERRFTPINFNIMINYTKRDVQHSSSGRCLSMIYYEIEIFTLFLLYRFNMMFDDVF